MRDTAKPDRSDPANPKWRKPRSRRCSAAMMPTASCFTSTMGNRGSFRVLVIFTTGPPQAARPSASSSLKRWAMTPSGCHSLLLLSLGSATSGDRAAELAWLRVSVSQAPKTQHEGSAGACAPASPAPGVAPAPPLAKIRVSPLGGGAGPSAGSQGSNHSPQP